ncbi:hypothetical protein KW481_18220 [Vibrio fluvialis]|nr:hypothetical protein [Vibrio fluvialis]MBY8194498.1 hypothetical protein [Vibrio fluvialis]
MRFTQSNVVRKTQSATNHTQLNQQTQSNPPPNIKLEFRLYTPVLNETFFQVIAFPLSFIHASNRQFGALKWLFWGVLNDCF